MPTVRKMPAATREELDAINTALNALIADLAAFGLLGDNVLVGMDADTAIVADLTALRTTLAAGVVDLGVLRTPIVAALVDLAAMKLREQNGAATSGQIADGTTDGKIKTVASCDYKIAGQLFTKAITDDLWNLTAEVDTDGTHYRAYWLYLAANGTASIAAGTDALTSAANAIAALPALDSSKAAIGVYVAGPSTDFNGAAGLTAQGTLINGYPSGYTLTAVSPAALTATTPAAITTVAPTSTNAVSQGGTAGRIKLAVDAEYEIGGVRYEKAPTDNLWNLSALATLSGTAYRATALYLNSSGTASIASGATATTAAAAIANLEAIPSTKSRIAVFVGSPNCVYTNALDAQGTYYIGRPAAFTPTATAITLIAP